MTLKIHVLQLQSLLLEGVEVREQTSLLDAKCLLSDLIWNCKTFAAAAFVNKVFSMKPWKAIFDDLAQSDCSS